MMRFFTLFLLLFSIQSKADNISDLVSEKELNSVGCFFVPDTSENTYNVKSPRFVLKSHLNQQLVVTIYRQRK